MSPAARRRELLVLGLMLCGPGVAAQDLDPRAYVRIPVDATLLVAGFSMSNGAVVTDAASPVQDLDARVLSPVLGVGRSFALFGQTAQAFVSVPYAWADVTGVVRGVDAEATRRGFGDARMRVTVLPIGAPAATPRELAASPRRTIVGASLTVTAPIGQYSRDLLINLGTHRWTFKPEVALSAPLGRRWLLDAYAGVWLFTDNAIYYPGSTVRSQAPLGTFQAHVSYNFTRLLWAALDATFYTGGETSLDGVAADDRQSNARVGATVGIPVGRRHALKISGSTGAIVRAAANFTTFSIGWQTAWLPTPSAAH